MLDPYGYALEAAIYKYKGKSPLIEKLLQQAGAQDPEGRVLAAAIKNENYTLAEKLIKQGVSKDFFGEALEAAKEKGNTPLIKMLSPDKHRDEL